MDSRVHARRFLGNAGSGGSRGAWARRKPMLSLRLSGVFLLRLAARTLRGLLFQEPPRSDREPPRPAPGRYSTRAVCAACRRGASLRSGGRPHP